MALDLRSYFANVPKKQLYTLACVLGLAILAAYAYFLILPQWDEMGRLQFQLQKLQADLSQKQAVAANRSKLEAELKVLEENLKVALVKLPEEKDIPNLLTKVNTLGQESGLEFFLFKPGPPVRRGFYAEVPIDMRVQGGYHALGKFLDRVSKLERIVNVNDIKIVPLPANQQADAKTVVADLKAMTYTFVEKGGSAGAPAKA